MNSDFSGAGMAALLVSLNIMLTLHKKQILSLDDSTEIIEQALLNLESHQALAQPTEGPTIESARALLDQLRKLISHP